MTPYIGMSRLLRNLVLSSSKTVIDNAADPSEAPLSNGPAPLPKQENGSGNHIYGLPFRFHYHI